MRSSVEFSVLYLIRKAWVLWKMSRKAQAHWFDLNAFKHKHGLLSWSNRRGKHDNYHLHVKLLDLQSSFFVFIWFKERWSIIILLNFFNERHQFRRVRPTIIKKGSSFVGCFNLIVNFLVILFRHFFPLSLSPLTLPGLTWLKGKRLSLCSLVVSYLSPSWCYLMTTGGVNR